MRTVSTLVRDLRSGRLHPVTLLEEHLDRVEREKSLNAFLWSDRERLLGAARAAVAGGVERRPLAGLPIALKDNIDTAGIPTTSGSLVDRERLPVDDAEAWRRLRDAGGALLLGKAHMSEFAYRSHHPALGRVYNPRNPARATGGSSSGCAAAVAAGICAAAIGTDTGGSVRIPAAYCGVVGVKGTAGAVSTDGVVPLSGTMDHVGVLAGNVSDAALVFEQLTERPVRLLDAKRRRVPPADPGALRVGVEGGWFSRGAQPAVTAAGARAVEALRSAGARVVEVTLPNAGAWRAAHSTILLREAWLFHAERLRAGARYGPVFHDAVSRGEEIAPATYERALAVRRGAQLDLAHLFERVDVLITPTCPTVAPPGDEGRRRKSYTRYTTLAAFAGVPAISIPAGSGQFGLPVGVQLIAAADAEAALFRAAALLEGLLAPTA